MARSYGRFTTSIWRDPDFTSLEQDLQAVYFMLCTQPDVTAAGSLAVTTGRWARFAADVTRSQVDEQITALQTHTGRHVIVDYDTEELLIRTFVKWDGGWSNSKRLPVIFEALKAIASVHIRDTVVDELRKIADGIGHTDADKQARDALSVRLNEYVNAVPPSDRSALAFDLEPLTSTPTPKPGAAASADADPPSMFCDEHPNGTTNSCGGCARAREVYAAAAQSKLSNDIAAQQARRAAIAACPLCDDNGKRVEGGRIVARYCDHLASSAVVSVGTK